MLDSEEEVRASLSGGGERTRYRGRTEAAAAAETMGSSKKREEQQKRQNALQNDVS